MHVHLNQLNIHNANKGVDTSVFLLLAFQLNTICKLFSFINIFMLRVCKLGTSKLVLLKCKGLQSKACAFPQGVKILDIFL